MKLKDKYNSYSESQKNIIKMFGILIVIVLVFFIAVLVMKISRGKGITYSQLETVITRAAEKYVKENPEVLENNVYGSLEISADTLTTKGYMNSVETSLGKDKVCRNVSVLVYKNLDNYKYIPKLDCDGYKTQSLAEKILSDDNIVTEGSGIYKDENIYVYRGEQVENYLTFAGQTWRIIEVDNNGYIKIIQENIKDYSVWDDRYNTEKGYKAGINLYEGVEASRLKDSIMNIYNNIDENVKDLVVPRQYCIGKRSKLDTDKTGNTECTLKTELIGATTVNVYEYLRASLDPDCKTIKDKSCSNYNYLGRLDNSYWTVTAQEEESDMVYSISRSIESSQANMSLPVRLVITINGNINYDNGTGTKTDPYIVK